MEKKYGTWFVRYVVHLKKWGIILINMKIYLSYLKTAIELNIGSFYF